MADAFDDFGRGDVLYGGSSIGEVVSGDANLDNGSGLVQTLRRGIAGSHKGTQKASIGFQLAQLKAGMRQNFVDVVLKGKVVRIIFVVDDVTRLQVQGIIRTIGWTFAESSMLTGKYGIEGRPSLV